MINSYLNLNFLLRWLFTEATVQKPLDTWQLVFEGVRGFGDLGKIAIDDIRITRGSCPNFGDCTFEGNSYCGYRNLEGNDFDWILKSGLSPNYPNGLF
jgi:hypothetical protein